MNWARRDLLRKPKRRKGPSNDGQFRPGGMDGLMPWSERGLSDLKAGQGFGGWKYEPEVLALCLYDDEGNWHWDVDLERCTTSAQVLDGIMQVSGKYFSTPET